MFILNLTSGSNFGEYYIKQYNQFLKLKIEQKELERKLEEDNK